LFKVALIGPEASGKSTLAQELAAQFHGTYVPEYAREYIERKGSLGVSFDELCTLARHQIEELKHLTGEAGLSVSATNGLCSFSERSERSIIFFDTELLVTKVWFDYAFHRIPDWLDDAIRVYPMDMYLLTYPDLPWHQDGARYNGSDAMRIELFDRYEQEIQSLGIPYFVIRH